MKIEFTIEQAQAVASLISAQVQQNKTTMAALDGAFKAIIDSSKGQDDGEEKTDN